MYNNSNGNVEHAESSKEDAAQSGTKSEVKKEGTARDADSKEALVEEVLQEEEEEEEEVEALEHTEGDADETGENITESLEKDDADAEEADGAKAKQIDQDLSDAEDDKKITIEILKPGHDEKEMAANVSREEKLMVELAMCRVCMGTEELSDIFQLEGPVRVSDIIMKVCTNIRITARDHLPHKICERCLG
uniref:ZAD domain-containing protein n=1 Tax=Anopheles maculatus TaxID=74869 RepID=A0A182SFP8_9DIPT